MKVVIFIAGLVGLGALAGAFDAQNASERRFDLSAVLIAAVVLAAAALIDRARSGSTTPAKLLLRQIETILLYAIAIPAVAYWIIATAFELGPDGRWMVGTVVGLGGLGLAMWRWERGD